MFNNLLGYIATTAEDIFWQSLGLASYGAAYEPEMSEEVKAIKAQNVSKLEKLYTKFAR